MKPIRILWICSHRTHRYEEVSLLLRAGAEVVPISVSNPDFPNAVEVEDSTDRLYVDWRKTLTMPEEITERIRCIDFYSRYENLSQTEKEEINNWFDVIIVASYSKIVASLLGWFQGYVILRVFGGYPYSGVFKPLTISGHRKLNLISRSPNYIWCPNIPYLTFLEDERITRNEVIIPACVSADRYPCEWKNFQSTPYICDVISLVEKYRSKIYLEYVNSFGELPLKIFGQNDKTGKLVDDSRIVGTLNDEQYYNGLSKCRAMLYFGLNNKYHIHYHVVEALMMKIPIIFFSESGFAHIARYYGQSDEHLSQMGMCQSKNESVELANHCLSDVEFAIQLSNLQEPLRGIYSPEKALHIAKDLIANLVEHTNYKRHYPIEPLGVSKRRIYKMLKTITG